jgi:O-methyltransferase
MNSAQELYLELMKKCLTYYLWGETVEPLDLSKIESPVKRTALKIVGDLLQKQQITLMRKYAFDPNAREEGLDWPPLADTMIGIKRLDNIQFCLETVIRDRVPGDCIETGLWRGGASIFMRAVLKAYGITDRTVWLADSFAGLPPPDAAEYPQDSQDIHHTIKFLAVSREEVEKNFVKYGLFDSQVRFLKGWFKDTLPNAPIQKLSVIRLDGDMYESTMEGLKYLYPKLSAGGFVIVDDYALKGCKEAVHDFRASQGINDEIIAIDTIGVYWRRNRDK